MEWPILLIFFLNRFFLPFFPVPSFFPSFLFPFCLYVSRFLWEQEAGKKLTPLYGPGYTGMRNLGNRFELVGLVYTYDASISISHVWTGTTQAQEKGKRSFFSCARASCAFVVPVHTWLMLVLKCLCLRRTCKPAFWQRESKQTSMRTLRDFYSVRIFSTAATWTPSCK